jgi:PHD/YefM family antitoxin component YafN of YafNO toxin-antitoxin module
MSATQKTEDRKIPIIPIRDLKNTAVISQMCLEADGPIFVTKNGYGDMVIMSMESYHRSMLLSDVYARLAAAEAQVSEGRTVDASDSLQAIRRKYNV